MQSDLPGNTAPAPKQRGEYHPAVCLHCCRTAAGERARRWESTRETIRLIGQILLIIMQALLAVAAGVFMFGMILFPPQSAKQKREQDALRRKKDIEWQMRRAEQDEWEAAEAAYFWEKKEEYEQWKAAQYENWLADRQAYEDQKLEEQLAWLKEKRDEWEHQRAGRDVSTVTLDLVAGFEGFEAQYNHENQLRVELYGKDIAGGGPHVDEDIRALELELEKNRQQMVDLKIRKKDQDVITGSISRPSTEAGQPQPTQRL